MTFPCPHVPPLPSAIDLAYLVHAVSTTSTATIPACQDGDLGVFLAWGTGGGSTTPAAIATPSGWTSVGGVVWGSGDRHRLQVFAKLLTNADGGATLTGITGGQASRNTVYVFRGAIPLSSLGFGDFEGVVTSGDPPAVTIACTSASRKAVLAMALRAQRTNETWTPITFSPAETGAHDLLDEGRIQVLWLAFPDDAPADVSADTGDSGTGNTFATWFIDVE